MERLWHFLRVLRSFFVALFRSFRDSDSRYIKVSHGLYFFVPKTKIRLTNSDLHSIGLSIADVRKVFSAMRAACDAHETRVFQVGSLEWTIDARTDTEIIITIRDGLSSFSHPVNWRDIERATTEFSSWLEHAQSEVNGTRF